MNIITQINAILDHLGIHLDAQSFENLLGHLRIDRLNWKQRLLLSIGVGVIVEIVRQRAKEAAQAKAEQIATEVATARADAGA